MRTNRESRRPRTTTFSCSAAMPATSCSRIRQGRSPARSPAEPATPHPGGPAAAGAQPAQRSLWPQDGGARNRLLSGQRHTWNVRPASHSSRCPQDIRRAAGARLALSVYCPGCYKNAWRRIAGATCGSRVAGSYTMATPALLGTTCIWSRSSQRCPTNRL